VSRKNRKGKYEENHFQEIREIQDMKKAQQKP
jgi:2-phosphoglycerate kinase